MEIAARLESCLQDEDAAVLSFTALLEEESGVLTSRHAFGDLQAVSERKQRFAEQLGMLGARRDVLLGELGLPAGHEGMRQAAAEYPGVGATWEALLAHCAHAAGLNERNGALVALHLRHADEALDALRTLLPDANGLYSASGRSRGPGSNRNSIVAR